MPGPPVQRDEARFEVDRGARDALARLLHRARLMGAERAPVALGVDDHGARPVAVERHLAQLGAVALGFAQRGRGGLRRRDPPRLLDDHGAAGEHPGDRQLARLERLVGDLGRRAALRRHHEQVGIDRVGRRGIALVVVEEQAVVGLGLEADEGLLLQPAQRRDAEVGRAEQRPEAAAARHQVELLVTGQAAQQAKAQRAVEHARQQPPAAPRQQRADQQLDQGLLVGDRIGQPVAGVERRGLLERQRARARGCAPSRR